MYQPPLACSAHVFCIPSCNAHLIGCAETARPPHAMPCQGGLLNSETASTTCRTGTALRVHSSTHRPAATGDRGADPRQQVIPVIMKSTSTKLASWHTRSNLRPESRTHAAVQTLKPYNGGIPPTHDTHTYQVVPCTSMASPWQYGRGG